MKNPTKGTPLDETWNYRIPESLADLIPLFENRVACHRLWADWLGQDTDETRRYGEHGLGHAKNHWDYVKQYSAAKSLIEKHLRNGAAVVTEAMVDAAAKAMHDGPLGTDDEAEYTSDEWNRPAEWCRDMARVPLTALGAGSVPGCKPREIECHGLDTPERVCFYEQDFYVLSNFSSFTLKWKDLRFDTSEAAYHWEKFDGTGQLGIQEWIWKAPSAHEAFKIAERNKHLRRPDWDDVKIDVMRRILFGKADQHEYVKRKLLATGDRELVENSWRDDFWGWGPNRDGKNVLGRLWMEVRAALAASASEASRG
ncbi:NADAR family protein [Mesorhizobium sp.]|uniref:NADAR family protein n=1 Tax=Mesorhizobium sp. TaxID=1871066 RepID=UPI001212F708|nr:NADAR family protein [Mesorhizobium sp.]TIM05746.1 MAG: NADAR family protein [Mesorhizobium sp.]